MRLLSIPLALLTLLLAGEVAVACRMAPCVLPEVENVRENSKILFRGRLERILQPGRGYVVSPADDALKDRRVLEFEVLDVWQGDVSPLLRVVVGIQNGGNCERSYFIGEEYLLWSWSGTPDGRIPAIENCGGIGRGGWPEEQEIDLTAFASLLGPPKWSAAPDVTCRRDSSC